MLDVVELIEKSWMMKSDEKSWNFCFYPEVSNLNTNNIKHIRGPHFQFS